MQERAPSRERVGDESPPGRRGSLAAQLFQRDHTSGSIPASIAVLAVPAILSSLAGMGLFQLVELWFVGRLGSAAVAAMGVTASVLAQVGALGSFGLGIGTQTLVAQLVGAGRTAEAERVAGQAVLLVLALFAVIGLAGQFPEALLGLITRDPAVIEAGALYVRLVLTLQLFGNFNFLLTFILAGAGETTTPLLLMLLATPVSVFAQWCLAFGNLGAPALGLPGIALGSAAGSFASLLVALVVIRSGRLRIRLRARHLLPDPALLRRLGATSWPPALQMVSPLFVGGIFMLLAGRLGTEVQAGYTIGLRIEALPFMIAFPIANAAATLVGQNLGAGRVARARRSVIVAMGVQVATMGALAVGLFLARETLVARFTSDPAVAEVAAGYVLFACANFLMFGVGFVCFRALQGAGDMVAPMLVSLAAAIGIAGPLAFLLTLVAGLGPTGMWIANVAYSTSISLALATWFATGRWARRAS